MLFLQTSFICPLSSAFFLQLSWILQSSFFSFLFSAFVLKPFLSLLQLAFPHNLRFLSLIFQLTIFSLLSLPYKFYCSAIIIQSDLLFFSLAAQLSNCFIILFCSTIYFLSFFTFPSLWCQVIFLLVHFAINFISSVIFFSYLILFNLFLLFNLI